MSENRRRFHRIQFDCTASLEVDGVTYSTPLIDISLKGALLSRPIEWRKAEGRTCVVNIQLDTEATQIRMEGTITHVESDRLGIRCNHLDIESAGHLRRIVELNLGDADLLNRELAALI